MKLKLILASAVALVMAAPANAAYFQVDFQTQGNGTRTYYEQPNGTPRFQYVHFYDITFRVLVPDDQFSNVNNYGTAFGQGFSLSSDATGVTAYGDSSADSGTPDYRYGFDFAFRALFANDLNGMLPLGLTDATGSAVLDLFTSSPAGSGYRDEYRGSVTGLRVTLIEGSTFGTSFVYAIPEPATWAMMLVGFGMMGGALRYHRRGTKVVYG